jgi:hypothetical protein
MIIQDKMPQMKRSIDSVMGDALREGCKEIIDLAISKTPLNLSGNLRADKGITSDGRLKMAVWWGNSPASEYTLFQEFGGDKNRRVKKYTTPGTGAHFLKNAGDRVTMKMNSTFQKHGLRARP